MEDYRVLKKVGTGSYGSAYLVCSKQDPQQQYVLKKIQSADVSDKERQVAWNEVEVLSKLDHPFVLGYIQHFTYKQQLCIITNYCEHGDLHQYMQNRRQQGQLQVPEQQALTWFVQMVLALQHVHSHSMLHRDIKTQNLFLTAAGYVKLGDFGIARSLGNTVGMASTLVGTPYYMSPEVLQNLPYDYQSDMWSSGCVLYEMLSARQAFDAPDFPSLMAKIVAGVHQPMPKGASSELQGLIKRLLSSDPQQRPSCDTILAQPFLQPYVTAVKQLVAELQGKKLVQQQLAAAAAVLASYIPNESSGSGEDARLLRAFDFVRKRASRAASKADGSQQAAVEDGDALDEEVQAAIERLRAIEAQREAIREQLVLFQQLPAVPPTGSGSCPSSRSSVTQLQLSPATSNQQAGLQLMSPKQQPAKLVTRSARSFTGGSSSSKTAVGGRQRRASSQSQVVIDSTSSTTAVASAAAAAGRASLDQLTANCKPPGPCGSQVTCSIHANQGPLVSAMTAAAVASAGAAAMAAIEQMLRPTSPHGIASSQSLHTRHVSFTSASRLENLIAGNGTAEAAAAGKTAGSAPGSVSNSARSSRRQLQLDPIMPPAGCFPLLSEQSSEVAVGEARSVQLTPRSSAHNSSQQPAGHSSQRSHIRASLDAGQHDVAVGSRKHPADELQSVSSILSPVEAVLSPQESGTGLLTADVRTTSNISDISSMSVWVGPDDPLSSLFSSTGSGCSGNGAADNSSSSESSSLTHAEALKARREARKAEELRRHEAELEQARRSYRQERAAAAVRASSLYEGSPGNCIVPAGYISNSANGGSSSSQPVGRHPSRRSSRSQTALALSVDPVAPQEVRPAPATPAGALSQSPTPGKPPLAGRRVSRRTIDMAVQPDLDHMGIFGLSGSRPECAGVNMQCCASQEVSSAHPGARYAYDAEDDGVDIDNQLAAIAELRKANNAFRSPALMPSPSPVQSPVEMGHWDRGGLRGLLQPKRSSSFDLGQHGSKSGVHSSMKGPPGGEWKVQGSGNQASSGLIKANWPCSGRHSHY